MSPACILRFCNELYETLPRGAVPESVLLLIFGILVGCSGQDLNRQCCVLSQFQVADLGGFSFLAFTFWKIPIPQCACSFFPVE